MAPDNNDVRSLIEEYKELRSEIRMYLDRRTKNVQFSFVFTVAVAGLYDRINNPYFYLAACIVIAFIWFDQIRQLRAVVRVATFLELYVEPKVPGLKWETYSAHHPITMRKGRKTSFVERSIANGAFPLFLIGLGLIALLDKGVNWCFLARVGLAIVLFLIVLLLLWKSYVGIDRDDQLDTWRRVEAEITQTKQNLAAPKTDHS